MKPSAMSDQMIIREMITMAAHGRTHTRRFIEFLAVVDQRKLYLKIAYPSLFAYLTMELLFSSGSAQRRIDAARILQTVPTIGEKIESGEIKLSQISKMRAFCRQHKKGSGDELHPDFQKSVMQKLEGKNAVETDLILAQEFQTELKIKERKSIQADESIRVELTFSKQEMEIIEKAQNILSNKTGGGLRETFLEMAQKVVKSMEPKGSTAKMAVKNTPDKKKNNVEKGDDNFQNLDEVTVPLGDPSKSRAHLFNVSQLESRGEG